MNLFRHFFRTLQMVRPGLLLLASVLLLTGCSMLLSAPVQGLAALLISAVLLISGCDTGTGKKVRVSTNTSDSDGDDSSLDSLSIADVETVENEGQVTLTVTRSGAAEEEATVDYATTDDTAEAGSDYVSTSGSLTFAAGETSKTIAIELTNDSTFERMEFLRVTLSNATNATISDATAVVSLRSDENYFELNDLGSHPELGFIMEGPSAAARLGNSVAGIGDVNADGFDDLGVAALDANTDEGNVFVVWGGDDLQNVDFSSGFSSQAIEISGDPGNHIGHRVSAAGDFNGDGIDDFMLSSTYHGANRGYSWLVSGDPALTGFTADIDISPAGHTILGGGGGDEFGTSLALAGDTNGDGFDDLVFGAQFYNGDQGMGNLVLGSDSLIAVQGIDDNPGDPTVGMALSGDNGWELGASAAGNFDFDGDGRLDIAFGGEYAEYSYNGKIAVLLNNQGSYIYDADVNSLGGAGIIINGEAVGGHAGASLAGVKDFDGDGIDDLLIGAPNVFALDGRTYLVFGDASPTGFTLSDDIGARGFVFKGENLGRAGQAVAGLVDITGDGQGDLLIGAPTTNSGEGRVYLVFSGVDADDTDLSDDMGTAGITFAGIGVEYVGTSVASAGDVNGDGYEDIVIGAMAHGSYTGRVYVVYGPF